MGRLAFLTLTATSVILATACSQTPVVVPVRSMERPRDVDFICLQHVDATTWKGVPLEKCQLDATYNPVSATPYFRLHAVVTQISRGELAAVDLGYAPSDPDGGQIVKVDPRLPGFTFLPVGKVPSDVAADPAGQAVYVASGRESRIDIIPAELLRGPVDTSIENGEGLPWPHVDFTPTDGAPRRLTIVRDTPAPTDPPLPYGAGRLYATLPDAVGGPKIAVFDLGDSTSTSKALLPARLADIQLTRATPAESCTPARRGGRRSISRAVARRPSRPRRSRFRSTTRRISRASSSWAECFSPPTTRRRSSTSSICATERTSRSSASPSACPRRASR
jgi:hypothetical protein